MVHLHVEPLATARLRLRPMAVADAMDLYAIYGDPEVMRHASEAPFPHPATVLIMLQSVERLLAAQRSVEWGIEETAVSRLVGTCGLHSFADDGSSAEVGCLLARAAWGRGLMREALTAVIAWADQPLGLTALRADIDAANARSQRLFAALGFRPVAGTLHERAL